MYKWLIVACVVAASSAVLGEQVKFQRCPEQSAKQCTINKVQINPCPEALEGLPCRVKKGRSVAIDIDFVPEFSASRLHSQAYWANGRMDLPLANMDTDACKSVSCPMPEGESQTYHWTLDVDKKFPTRQFNVKMKLKDQDNEANFCCLLFNIKLTK